MFIDWLYPGWVLEPKNSSRNRAQQTLEEGEGEEKMNRYLFVISVLAIAFGSQAASGEELRAKIVCKDGICTPVASGTNAADLKKVQALARRAAQLKKAIDEADGRDRSRVDQFTDEVNRLRKEVENLKTDRDAAGSALNNVSNKANEADRVVRETRDSLARLAKDVSELQAKANAAWRLAKHLAKLPRPKIDLELGAAGFFTYRFGDGAGAMLALVLPMGNAGRWNMRLSGGLGVSPSLGLGWMAHTSLAYRWKHISLGPAALALGDQGDLLSGTKNWIVGGGADLRLHLGRFYLAATPFIGAATKTSTVGVGEWVMTKVTSSPAIPNCPCSGGTSGEGYWTGGTENKRCVGLAGGVLLQAGVSLF